MKELPRVLVFGLFLLLPMGCGADEKSPTTPEATEKNAYTKMEAWKESNTAGIVFHYGDKIDGVDDIVEILEERGYRAKALPGGPENGVQFFALGGFSKVYDQSEVNGGELALHAMGKYDKRAAKAAAPEKVALEGKGDATSEASEKKAYTKMEAWKESKESGIILHYGKDINGAEETARVLVKRGYPSKALPGRPEGGVQLFTLGGFGKVYSQDEIYLAELGDDAMGAYDAVMKKRAGTSDSKSKGSSGK